MRLAGKATIVTGATRGIGRAIALAFAREGADVLVHGRDERLGAEVVREIQQGGRRAVWHRAELADAEQARGIVRAALEAFGRLDVLVNNAGLYQRQSVLEIEEADWDRILDVNLKGAFFCSQAAGRVMKQQRGGVILQETSDAAWSGGVNVCAHYAASKAGMASLTRSLAKELAPHGI